MNWMLALAFFGIGVVITTLVFLVRDEYAFRQYRDEAENAIFNPESWCCKNCKIYAEVDSKYKNYDKVIDELVNERCVDCPISIAEDIISATGVTKK